MEYYPLSSLRAKDVKTSYLLVRASVPSFKHNITYIKDLNEISRILKFDTHRQVFKYEGVVYFTKRAKFYYETGFCLRWYNDGYEAKKESIYLNVKNPMAKFATLGCSNLVLTTRGYKIISRNRFYNKPDKNDILEKVLLIGQLELTPESKNDILSHLANLEISVTYVFEQIKDTVYTKMIDTQKWDVKGKVNNDLEFFILRIIVPTYILGQEKCSYEVLVHLANVFLEPCLANIALNMLIKSIKFNDIIRFIGFPRIKTLMQDSIFLDIEKIDLVPNSLR